MTQNTKRSADLNREKTKNDVELRKRATAEEAELKSRQHIAQQNDEAAQAATKQSASVARAAAASSAAQAYHLQFAASETARTGLSADGSPVDNLQAAAAQAAAAAATAAAVGAAAAAAAASSIDYNNDDNEYGLDGTEDLQAPGPRGDLHRVLSWFKRLHGTGGRELGGGERAGIAGIVAAPLPAFEPPTWLTTAAVKGGKPRGEGCEEGEGKVDGRDRVRVRDGHNPTSAPATAGVGVGTMKTIIVYILVDVNQ